jgi:hypothetical protein
MPTGFHGKIKVAPLDVEPFNNIAVLGELGNQELSEEV